MSTAGNNAEPPAEGGRMQLRNAKGGARTTHDCAASETRTRGLSRSSLRRRLCSVSRRSLSSLIDCFPVLGIILGENEGWWQGLIHYQQILLLRLFATPNQLRDDVLGVCVSRCAVAVEGLVRARGSCWSKDCSDSRRMSTLADCGEVSTASPQGSLLSPALFVYLRRPCHSL